ncbi:hypothetical protein [Kitasatospora aureofaciens]|uniref:hypothetical protein n=1 Tax=Kitasatospora aureofaciens TaxID=1894 RepID=UPI001C44E021|nr:hypothetical protein [Kitasatospora aureofaciens]MBV6696643.1 hypothetical protein [Kitasatospora aureofaciens]
MVLFLVVVIVAIVLGVVGILVHGLFYLIAVAVLLLVADVVFLAVRSIRNRRSLR